MGRGKYERIPNSTNNKYLKRPSPDSSFAYKYDEQSHTKKQKKFKMNKRFKQKICAILSATALTMAGMQIFDAPYHSSQSGELPDLTYSPEEVKTEIVYSIGIADPNTKIEVDGKHYEIDPNSFVIVSEDTALAYDTNGNILKGAIDSENFTEVKKLTEEEMSKFNIRQVISKEYVNVRSSGEILDNNLISTVPENDYVLAYEAVTPETDDKEWLYTLSVNNGTLYEGYIREDLIKEVDFSDALYSGTEKNDANEEKNVSEKATGIDISSLSPKDLEQLLQTGIPDEVSSIHGTFDTSQLAGDIDFVYIKLGASPYKCNEFAPLEYDNYIKQVEICEKLGIPYGFYYYSTAITVEEAKMELDCIKERIEDLRKNYNLKNNKLEIAVDVELNNTSDRQYRGNIKEQTEAKATLINGIQELNLSDNVLIYGPSRVMKPDLDQVIDLSYLHTLLDNPDSVTLWQTSLMNKDGSTNSKLDDAISYAEKQGFSTSVCQLVLDGNVIGRIDINSMDRDHLESLLNQKSISYNEDFER